MRALEEILSPSHVRTSRNELRTPRHKSHRDQYERRLFTSSGQPRRPSRSRSPSRRNNANTSHHRTSPPPYSRSQSSTNSPSKQHSFQHGAGSKSACALCLGRDACDILKCQSGTFWDGSKARCRKNDQGRLVSPTGNILCFNWNTRRGCVAQGHDDRHECSGCGNKDHGAQECPRAQKKPASHPL
jgi:hypothetical protein